MKETVRIVGPCSKWVEEGPNRGWNTEIDKASLKNAGLFKLDDLKKAFWNYVAKHPVVVDNGNIDYIMEQVIKEEF